MLNNCTKVKISLMPFRIPKATFPPHFFRLYLRCCSLLWRNLFFIISYSKSILFLNLFVCNVNNSSMQFSGSVAALLSPILRKFILDYLKNIRQLLMIYYHLCFLVKLGLHIFDMFLPLGL